LITKPEIFTIFTFKKKCDEPCTDGSFKGSLGNSNSIVQGERKIKKGFIYIYIFQIPLPHKDSFSLNITFSFVLRFSPEKKY
jgi:hypothetical protein